ncbi:hypothetical protein GGTG_12757 [Gaeumannomyces tritici R3-111a-1]|uniref:Uncharacterized protein n=1 Tax=Gaeumannomyces tritici (strain R3-111a-1) TaxID=644352 RepID=J3PGX7_GAET3|nr:hypothetical protein GGTG_12757 [Gaeumannomyces tritici R3-111a-1]EJT69874.1 hypothetical protein GGTG_12757 [Gaeumannomyces tritici R3-111a-1]
MRQIVAALAATRQGIAGVPARVPTRGVFNGHFDIQQRRLAKTQGVSLRIMALAPLGRRLIRAAGPVERPIVFLEPQRGRFMFLQWPAPAVCACGKPTSCSTAPIPAPVPGAQPTWSGPSAPAPSALPRSAHGQSSRPRPPPSALYFWQPPLIHGQSLPR